MKASLNNYRQAPRKVRLVTDLIKGKNIEMARAELAHLPKRASGPVLKLLNSAVANSSEKENLYIKNVTVDRGVIAKRMRPRAHGRGFPIHKHSSHVHLTLAIREKAQAPKLKAQTKS